MHMREFLGRIEVFCADEDEIYVYDEITKGVYLIKRKSGVVRLLICKDVIFLENRIEERGIRGIIKRENELILIPRKVNRKWIHYDLINETVSYVLHVDIEYEVVEVACFENTFYLIPINPKEYILYGNMENLVVKKRLFSNDLLSKYKTKHVFGHCVSVNNCLVFPIVSSEYYSLITAEGASFFRAPCILLSISLYDSFLYCLPEGGDSFYLIEKNSGKVEQICFDGVSANEFKRVIATERGAVFCPAKGSVLVMYDKESHRFVNISLRGDHLEGELLYEVNCSYWTYSLKNHMLVFLPLRYRFACVSDDGTLFDEMVLIFDREEHSDKYYECIKEVFIQKRIINECKEYELEDYLKLI